MKTPSKAEKTMSYTPQTPATPMTSTMGRENASMSKIEDTACEESKIKMQDTACEESKYVPLSQDAA